jgi:hypothetical protein
MGKFFLGAKRLKAQVARELKPNGMLKIGMGIALSWADDRARGPEMANGG